MGRIWQGDTSSGSVIGRISSDGRICEGDTASGSVIGRVEDGDMRGGAALLLGLLGDSSSSGGTDNFFVRTFLKNPVGLTILGILVTIIIGSTLHESGSFMGYVIGVIITAIGILWFVMRIRRIKRFMASNLPIYLWVVDVLQKSGYEVQEFSRKRNEARAWVLLNGERLGQIFLVAPPPNGLYAQFRRIEGIIESDFDQNYRRKFGNAPEIPISFWPDNSLIGAFIDASAENCPEKEKWLSFFANLFQ